MCLNNCKECLAFYPKDIGMLPRSALLLYQHHPVQIVIIEALGDFLGQTSLEKSTLTVPQDHYLYVVIWTGLACVEGSHCKTSPNSSCDGFHKEAFAFSFLPMQEQCSSLNVAVDRMLVECCFML